MIRHPHDLRHIPPRIAVEVLLIDHFFEHSVAAIGRLLEHEPVVPLVRGLLYAMVSILCGCVVNQNFLLGLASGVLNGHSFWGERLVCLTATAGGGCAT